MERAESGAGVVTLPKSSFAGVLSTGEAPRSAPADRAAPAKADRRAISALAVRSRITSPGGCSGRLIPFRRAESESRGGSLFPEGIEGDDLLVVIGRPWSAGRCRQSFR